MIVAVRNVEVFSNGELSNEDYHKHDFVSSSALKTIHTDCPAVYKYAERTESPALAFGTASHAAVLEPELFDAQFVRDLSKDEIEGVITSEAGMKAILKDAGVKGYSTKKGQELIDMVLEVNPDAKIWSALKSEHEKANEGKTIVPATDYDNMMTMRNAIFANPKLKELFVGASFETSIICEVQLEGSDDWIGVKIRPDIITANCEVPDYKTTRDVRPAAFGRDAYYSGYLLRQMFVCDVLSAVYNREFKPGLLAQAKTSPFIPQLYWFTTESTEDAPSQCEIGRLQYTEALKYYHWCKTNDVWPAYSDDALELEIPQYVQRQYNYN